MIIITGLYSQQSTLSLVFSQLDNKAWNCHHCFQLFISQLRYYQSEHEHELNGHRYPCPRHGHVRSMDTKFLGKRGVDKDTTWNRCPPNSGCYYYFYSFNRKSIRAVRHKITYKKHAYSSNCCFLETKQQWRKYVKQNCKQVGNS